MKVFYIGANCRKGVSEKTGKPYEIAELSYSIPDESKEKKTADGTSTQWVYSGYGHAIRTIPINPSDIHNFKDVAPLTEQNLVIEPNPKNPSRNWVTGVK